VTRKSLLVGSIPAADAKEAVTLALAELGPLLVSVPDGETGPRSQWVAMIINGLRTNPALILKKDGRWSNYQDRPTYSVRRGARLESDSIELGYLNAFHESRSVVDALSVEYGVAPVTHQVGVASGFDLALFAFGPVGALRHRAAFNAAGARDIKAIADEAVRDVVFQIELPAETVAVARSPRLLRAAISRWLAGVSVELARSAPTDTRFGIHLCFGDLGNRALVTSARDCSAVVALTNAIVARWPESAELAYVHLPLAAGNEPPSTDAAFYAPLGKLELPQATRLIAGFVHEKLSEKQLLDILRAVEAAAGRTVDVAAPCGLGRRDQSVARDIMAASRTLCAAPRA
jgi:hypothetical protein